MTGLRRECGTRGTGCGSKQTLQQTLQQTISNNEKNSDPHAGHCVQRDFGIGQGHQDLCGDHQSADALRELREEDQERPALHQGREGDHHQCENANGGREV